MKKPTLLSFDLNSQDIHWTESRNQAKLALVKAYAVEVTEPVLYFTPPTNVMQMLRYKDPIRRVDGSKYSRKSSRPSLTVIP
jgi:hypothetical protein